MPFLSTKTDHKSQSSRHYINGRPITFGGAIGHSAPIVDTGLTPGGQTWKQGLNMNAYNVIYSASRRSK